MKRGCFDKNLEHKHVPDKHKVKMEPRFILEKSKK